MVSTHKVTQPFGHVVLLDHLQWGSYVRPRDKLNILYLKIESKEHFLLRCQFSSSQRLELFDDRNKTNSSFFKLSTKVQVDILLNGYIHQTTQFI